MTFSLDGNRHKLNSSFALFVAADDLEHPQLVYYNPNIAIRERVLREFVIRTISEDEKIEPIKTI